MVLAVGVFVFTAAMLVGTAGRGRADTTPTAFSDSRCSPVPNTSFTLSCTAPKSLGPGEKTTYSPLIFRTATNAAATATNLTAVATAKEQAVAKQGKNPPTATCPLPTRRRTRSASAPTSRGAAAASPSRWRRAPRSVSSSAGCQSRGPCRPASRRSPRLPGGVDDVHRAGGHDRGDRPVTREPPDHVRRRHPQRAQREQSRRPPHAVRRHGADGDQRQCSGDLFSGKPPDSEIPCRRVNVEHLGQSMARVEIDAWDLRNGDWTRR